jgi:hypothetical protein
VIRIHKPSEPPSILLKQGRASKEQLCRQADEDADAKLSFDKRVYGADEVKAVLRAAQHDKCCFCEAKVSPVAFGDVEHYRPKAAVRQSVNDPEIRRGYYWLAYEWPNLYFACEQCNRRHKRDYFPLENPQDRVLSHHEADQLARERPLFVDPGEEPERFIGFRKFFAAPLHSRGKHTIDPEGLNLNRPPLREQRRLHREKLLGSLAGISAWLQKHCPAETRSLMERAAGIILQAVRDEAEFASMSRALLRELIPWRAISPTTIPSDLLDQLEDDAVAGRWLVIPAS